MIILLFLVYIHHTSKLYPLLGTGVSRAFAGFPTELAGNGDIRGFLQQS